MSISSDGELLVSGCKDGTVWCWGARTGEAVGEPLRGHNGSVTRVSVSKDGNCIVSCSLDGDVRLWDTLSGEAIGIPLRGYGGEVTCIAISRDGKLVMSGSMDGNIRHWDVAAERNGSENHRLLTSLDENGFELFPRSIATLSVCWNGKIAVSGSKDGIVQRWDVLTGEAVGGPMLGDAESSEVYSVAISRDGTLIVSGDSDGIVRLWNASTGEAISEPMDGHSKEVSSIVISDDGKNIFTGSEDGTIRRWDARTGEEVGKPMKHSGGGSLGIESLVISTGGKLIVAGSNGSLGRCDARTGERIGDEIKVPGWALNVMISNDRETIACGSEDHNYVQKWETISGDPIGEPMKWSEGEHILDEMKRARLSVDQEFDVLVGKDRFPVKVKRTAVCPNQKKIVLGLDSGSVVICERR